MNLYKKYRPQNLSSFFGNENTIESLRSYLKKKEDFPSAIMFQGPTGCGKTTLARIVKTELGCLDEDFSELNVANTRGIDTIREIIQFNSFTSFSGGIRIFLFDECFPGNTKVLVDYNKAVRISDIVRNPNIEEVLSYDLENKRIVKKKIVRRIKRRFLGNRIKITLEVDGETYLISSTDSHKFYAIGKGYTPAKDLEVGDNLIKLQGYVTVKKIKFLEYDNNFRREGWVYNLEVENTHNYFACAEGKIVSNLEVLYKEYYLKGKLVKPHIQHYKKLLRDKNKFLPILVSNCHKFTSDAQNALLKISEDTPPKVYFILCTTDPEKVIKTLRNRCTIFQVSPLPTLTIIALLERICKLEKKMVSKDVLREITKVCVGSPRQALVILDQVIDMKAERALELVPELVLTEAKVLDVCKLLVKSKYQGKWLDMTKLLKSLESVEPEQARAQIAGYLASTLVRGGEDRIGHMLEFFSESIINAGRAGLILALWRSCRV